MPHLRDWTAILHSIGRGVESSDSAAFKTLAEHASAIFCQRKHESRLKAGMSSPTWMTPRQAAVQTVNGLSRKASARWQQRDLRENG